MQSQTLSLQNTLAASLQSAARYSCTGTPWKERGQNPILICYRNTLERHFGPDSPLLLWSQSGATARLPMNNLGSSAIRITKPPLVFKQQMQFSTARTSFSLCVLYSPFRGRAKSPSGLLSVSTKIMLILIIKMCITFAFNSKHEKTAVFLTFI